MATLDLPVQRRSFSELTVDELYAIIRLRVEVFTVEQVCPYQDLDGRDREPGALHLWIEHDGQILSYLRVLAGPQDHWTIGRVVTRRDARGHGHAASLINEALGIAGRPVTIHAQAHLAAWYEGFGFRVTGPEFDEDGIPHLPMILT